MAAKPVRFHEQADAEYEDALDWYLARSPQAATEFGEELTRAVELRGVEQGLDLRRKCITLGSPVGDDVLQLDLGLVAVGVAGDRVGGDFQRALGELADALICL